VLGCTNEIIAVHLMGVAADGDAELTAEAQVRNFEALLLGVYQQVLRLQVAVHHAMLVAVRHALDELVHEGLQGKPQQPSHPCTWTLTLNMCIEVDRICLVSQHAYTILHDQIGLVCCTLCGALTLTCMIGIGGDLGPLPVLSMNFFKSVVRYSKTWHTAQRVYGADDTACHDIARATHIKATHTCNAAGSPSTALACCPPVRAPHIAACM
jgi:hypothetical protein